MLVIRDIQEHYNQIRPTRKGGLYLLETWKLGRMLELGLQFGMKRRKRW